MKEWAFAVFSHVKQGACALRGHDPLLWFEADRLSLRCTACGWNSPGWPVAAARRSITRGTVPSRDGARETSLRVRHMRQAA
jgi:hypothetical protein